MLGQHENVDRRSREPNLEPVDVLLFTLDAALYLEKCLDTVYREVPVNRTIALDGGSKDGTLAILAKYPRMEIHVRPDIRTTGKGCEFLLGLATTPWVIFMDADIELPPGWYDEMLKYRDKYDFFGCKRIMHYEFYRVDPTTLDENERPLGAPWLARRDCFRNYHVDDDYMWRATDILLRQVAEKNGYRFGKVATTHHYHHTTDNPMYESDSEKRGSRLVFETPRMEILDNANWEKRLDDWRRAVVKYIEPEFMYPGVDDGLLAQLAKLDPEWVQKTNLEWYRSLQDYHKRQKMAGTGRKARRIAWHTRAFASATLKAFKDYLRNIREC